MGPLEWSLVGVAAWFLIGYTNILLVNGSPLGHILACGYGVCHHYDKSFRWGRPVVTKAGRRWFGAGVIAGPLGVMMTLIFLIVVILIELVYGKAVVHIGNLLAPK